MTGNPSSEFQNYNRGQTEGTGLPGGQDLRVSGINTTTERTTSGLSRKRRPEARIDIF